MQQIYLMQCQYDLLVLFAMQQVNSHNSRNCMLTVIQHFRGRLRCLRYNLSAEGHAMTTLYHCIRPRSCSTMTR